MRIIYIEDFEHVGQFVFIEELRYMSQLALTKATVLTPFNLIEEAVILIDGKRIIAVGAMDCMEIPPEFREVPLEGFLIAPGFIDLHLHGGGGAEIAQGTPESIVETAKFHATHGTTAFLATTISTGHDHLAEIAKSYASLKELDYKGAQCLGIHLEGPYISTQYPGIHPQGCLRLPSVGEMLSLQHLSNGGIKLLTMAPELPGALDVAATMASEGIISLIGHSAAGYDAVSDAISAGFKGVTHCFNQMSPFHHREPGIIGAALTRPELSIELIADGIHLHKAAIDIAWRCKGPDGIILVSDAMAPAGLLEGDFQTSIGRLTLARDGLKNEAGKIAGSVLTLDKAVKNILHSADCTLTEAFRMATYNPARFLGINKRKGSLYPGKDADLVVMTTDLEVVATMVGGEVISGLISLN
jgi:N-acetylglucosamine-6-phosphate deacetylase